MINIAKLEINTTNDYEKLFDIIDRNHIDEFVVSSLKEYIGIQCKMIIIEYPYYEKDYLSNYYRFYSKQHRDHIKQSYRLHFFSDKHQDDIRIYYGYITLRECVENSKIGSSYLSPVVFKNFTKAKLILSDFNATLYGESLKVKAFPWMSQETDVSVCAHVSIWSILRYFGNRRSEYRDTVMGEIVDSVESDKYGRKIPSHGLTLDQIVDVFEKYGLSPVLLGNKNQRIEFFMDEIISYIESGIPLAGVINSRNHAISIIGHTGVDISTLNSGDIERYKERGTNIVLHSKLVSGVYAIDDNHLPYRIIDKYLPISDSHVDYALSEISFIIVPYCDKVLLGYHNIYERFLEDYKRGWLKWKDKTVICKIYLVRANALKQSVKQDKLINNLLKSAILALDMPRFVWCVDLASPEEMKEGLISGRYIADSTLNTTQEDIWILAHDKDSLYIMDSNDGLRRFVSHFNSYKAYGGNLVDVNSIECCETGVVEDIYD